MTKPVRTLRPVYLSARESDGTFKWYVAITTPFSPKDGCLLGYGPRPDPDGHFHLVTRQTAAAKVQEKRDKGYGSAALADLPEVARRRLLDAVRESAQAPRVEFTTDGRILIFEEPTPTPRGKKKTHAVWL